jgi:hypothetical protein
MRKDFYGRPILKPHAKVSTVHAHRQWACHHCKRKIPEGSHYFRLQVHGVDAAVDLYPRTAPFCGVECFTLFLGKQHADYFKHYAPEFLKVFENFHDGTETLKLTCAARMYLMDKGYWLLPTWKRKQAS